jgi:hypothetical protein
MRRRWTLLLAAAKGDDGYHAGRPGGKSIGERHKFQDKRRQQEPMKPKQPVCQQHGNDINELIGNHPASRAKEKLQSIRNNGRRESKDDSGARQSRRAKQAVGLVVNHFAGTKAPFPSSK